MFVCLQVARVLNNVTWQPLLECHHGTPVDEPPGVAVYQEIEEQQPRRAPLLPVQVRSVVHVGIGPEQDLPLMLQFCCPVGSASLL